MSQPLHPCSVISGRPSLWRPAPVSAARALRAGDGRPRRIQSKAAHATIIQRPAPIRVPAGPESATDVPPAQEQAGAPPARPPTALAVRGRQAETLRSNIRTLAAQNGLTLAGLARRLGLRNANPALQSPERAHTHGLSQETLARLCAAFPGVTLEALIGGRAVPGAPATATASVPRQAGADEAGTPISSGARPPAANAAAGSRATVSPPSWPDAAARRDAAEDPVQALGMSLHGLRGALIAVERADRQLDAALKARNPRL
jgi:transcriptional regulator with XRE-family HTH domain